MLWVVKAPDELLILERPNVNVSILAAYSKQGVVRREGETTNMHVMSQSHQALGLIPSDVV